MAQLAGSQNAQSVAQRGTVDTSEQAVYNEVERGSDTAATRQARTLAKEQGLVFIPFAGGNIEYRMPGSQTVNARAYISETAQQYAEGVDYMQPYLREAEAANMRQMAESRSGEGDAAEKASRDVRKDDKKWHTGWSHAEVTELENAVAHDYRWNGKEFSSTANWYFRSKNGTDVFALYSTTDVKNGNPTVLYAVRGKQAKFERDYIQFIKEEYDVSANGGSKSLAAVLDSHRSNYGRGNTNTVKSLGAGTDRSPDRVYRRPSRRKPSQALENCIKNLLRAERGVNGKASQELAPTFYSKMEREVENAKQDKFGASSVVAFLRGRGVKAEEIKWSGVEQWLEGKKSVTKQELLDFMRANRLQIETEVLESDEAYWQNTDTGDKAMPHKQRSCCFSSVRG